MIIFLYALSAISSHKVSDLVENIYLTQYDLRAQAETLYRVKKNIRVSFGKILPSLNFNTLVGGPLASIQAPTGDYLSLTQVVANLVGFLFPSNWYQWKESRLFYHAQKRSYNNLVANQMSETYTLSLSVLLHSKIQQVFQSYALEMTRVIEKHQEKFKDDILSLRLENLKILVEQDSFTLSNTLENYYAELAHLVGLPIEERKNFKLQPIEMPNMKDYPYLDSEDYIEEVEENSLELETLKYLIFASRYTLKKRRFNFLSPNSNSDSNLGLGYGSYMAIGRSSKRELEIKKEEFRSNLTKTLEITVNNYNTALRILRSSSRGYQNARKWYDFIKKEINKSTEYNALDLVDALESLINFRLKVLKAKYTILTTKHQLSRLRMEGPYKRLLDFSEVPPFKKIRSFQRRENRKIEKAVKNGELDIKLAKREVICKKVPWYMRHKYDFKRYNCY